LPQNKSGRRIPKLNLDASPRPLSRKEAKESYERLMNPVLDGVRLDPDERFRLMSESELEDSKIVYKCFRNREYHALPLLEKYGKDFGYSLVSEAANVSHFHSPSSTSSITSDQLIAFNAISKAHGTAVIKLVGLTAYEQEKAARGADRPLLFHALQFPEDVPDIEGIIARGILNDNEILRILSHRNEDVIEPALTDGFL
jgi:hypothetical protein